ncbi:penicillin-binding protein 2 (pbp-2) [hydrocarbon metagenome]|uniref:Penicillin-binding protein 2 (Pbp-2) n=1 Tax=hydrocarbon metagenome TaxID=938273 RepID=A0A0W8E2Q6_9ZZZZ
MKAEELDKKLKVYTYIVILLLTLLGVRLAVVQLFNNETYQTQAKENRIRLLPIKAPRGEIYASNGEVLATNEIVYSLSLSYLGLSKQETVIDNLLIILEDYYPEITREYIEEKVELQKYRLYEPITLIHDISWDLVVKLEENRQTLPGVSIVVEPLRSYPRAELAGHILGYIHSIDEDELQNSEDAEYSINSLIGKSGIEKQYESVLKGSDGARSVEVDAQGRPIRDLVTLEPKQGNNLYLTLDMELQQVLQKSMENTLNQLQKKYPKAKVGSAVVINVKTGEILAMTSSPFMYPDDWKGNISSKRAEYYFPQTEAYDPLQPGAITNRSTQATYPPGSTFKMITGMAALDKEVVNPLKDYVKCSGNYWIAPFIRCWSVHGNVNYYAALAGSCNVYFQEMGRRAGQEEIIRVAREFGLGSRTGIDLPYESKGLLPTPEWKNEINALLIDKKYSRLRQELDDKYNDLLNGVVDEEEINRLHKKKENEKIKLEAQYKIDYNFDTTWQAYDTFNMAMGQGYNDYTVLQMANYVAAIANGGYLMQPYLLSKIVSQNGEIIEKLEPQIMNETDVNPSTISETKRAMLAVSQPGGTAHFLFYDFPEQIGVGAKTGTAQTGRAGDDALKEFHGVFVAFAPFDDPEIAFAGVVEYGYSGGESAGLVCRDVFKHYFGISNYLETEKSKKTGMESNRAGE